LYLKIDFGHLIQLLWGKQPGTFQSGSEMVRPSSLKTRFIGYLQDPKSIVPKVNSSNSR
jgi:hypothetical protein